MTARQVAERVLAVLADGYPEAGRPGVKGSGAAGVDAGAVPLLSFDELLLAMYPNFGRLEVELAKDQLIRDERGVLHAEKRRAA